MTTEGDFSFLKNRDIRLSYQYSFRQFTRAGVWSLLKEITLAEMFKDPRFTSLKMRKGASWARTLQVMHMISHQGWAAAVEELKAAENLTP